MYAGVSPNYGTNWGSTMTDHREADLRHWIQAAAARSHPIKLDDVLNGTPPDLKPRTPADLTMSEPTIIVDLAEETPVTNKRNLYLALAAAVAVIALGAYAVTNSDSTTVAANQGDPAPATTPIQATTSIPMSRTEMATAFWQAMAAGDRDQVLGIVDPAALDSQELAIWGRAQTLQGQFDWYESVGWKWQLSKCEPADDDVTIRCTASASNTWSESLGVEPVSGNFLVVFSDDGITDVTEELDSFISQWSPQVFAVFADWVQENHPDDAAIMFDFDMDINQEILDLYELNTGRFAESLQGA